MWRAVELNPVCEKFEPPIAPHLKCLVSPLLQYISPSATKQRGQPAEKTGCLEQGIDY